MGTINTYRQHIWVGIFDTESAASGYCYPDEYLKAWESKLGLELARCDLTDFYDRWENAVKGVEFENTPFHELLGGICKDINGAFTYLEDMEFHYEESGIFSELLSYIPANHKDISEACKKHDINSANCFLSYSANLLPNASPKESKKMTYIGSFPHETPMYLK